MICLNVIWKMKINTKASAKVEIESSDAVSNEVAISNLLEKSKPLNYSSLVAFALSFIGESARDNFCQIFINNVYLFL